MIKKEILMVIILAVVIVGTLNFVNSVGETNYCCEKTLKGDYCINTLDQTKCDTSVNPGSGAKFSSQPTFCETTSYCRLGYCYDSKYGTCLPNVPQSACNEDGGVWTADTGTVPPQCSLGCCILGDQAAFVTQVRCKKLSADYNLQTNFRTDITSETQCLSSVTSDVKGACVFEKDFETTCQILTQKECADLSSGTQTQVNFHAGLLCTAEELGTNCGRSKQTTCVDGKDGVYFLDTCGNVANIYDATKVDNIEYWTNIKLPSESCNPDRSNANDPKCGNCDYYQGSDCHAFDKNQDKVQPNYGNNICRNLDCVDDKGNNYRHGETWCSTNVANAKLENTPGSEYFRNVCYNGEITIENCAGYRAERCIQKNVSTADGPFKVAACSANLWQDCIAQETKKDCENLDKRDCLWTPNGDLNSSKEPVYVCVPKYAPGFNFWEEGDAQAICPVASTNCTATLKKGLGDFVKDIFGDAVWHCDNSDPKNNCQCCVNDPNGDKKNENEGCTGVDTWVGSKLNICGYLGDCGIKTNYISKAGFYTKEETYSFS